MTTRFHLAALLAACSLLLAGPTHAASTDPTAAQARRPTPTRRAPTARPNPAPLAPAAAPAPAPPPEATPRTIVLAGTVQAADGRPYPGVCVFPTSNPRLLAVTDATGAFRLQVPAPLGNINLQADYFGVASRRVAVDAQHPQAIRIVLGQ